MAERRTDGRWPAIVVAATGNAGKLVELTALLRPLDIEVLPPHGLGLPDVEETATTYVENALLKARSAARHCGLAALADDSGLEVDALGGGPGLHSARYAGLQASAEDNNRKLLHAMQGLPPEQRGARFRCLVVLLRSADDPAPLICEGVWPGHIALAPAGDRGFGYDPLFIPNGSAQTAAQMPGAEKQRRSHRGKALAGLAARLARDRGHG